jgi:hypothetical protein
MEGFVHQTREQRLNAVRAALTRVYSDTRLSGDFNADEALGRIERAEQQCERAEQHGKSS